MSEAALRATGLLMPGSLMHWIYRISLRRRRQPAGDAAVDTARRRARKAFPEAGWEVRTRKNVSPQFSRNLDRFSQFLTLVGLTALIIGGVGVANAIRAFVERKRATVATLKALGATGSTSSRMMLHAR